jgi:hypothetical protein
MFSAAFNAVAIQLFSTSDDMTWLELYCWFVLVSGHVAMHLHMNMASWPLLVTSRCVMSIMQQPNSVIERRSRLL